MILEKSLNCASDPSKDDDASIFSWKPGKLLQLISIDWQLGNGAVISIFFYKANKFWKFLICFAIFTVLVLRDVIYCMLSSDI